MNIFFLDYDPQRCAQLMVDSHVSKMILETAQLLSTAHHLNGKPHPALYKPTHQHHPSAVWARQSTQNYKWLVNHFHGLAGEFMYRFGGSGHKSYNTLVDLLCEPPSGCIGSGLTVPKPAMDSEYILYDGVDWGAVVLSYRNYYKHAKSDLHKWTGRPRPEFC